MKIVNMKGVNKAVPLRSLSLNSVFRVNSNNSQNYYLRVQWCREVNCVNLSDGRGTHFDPERMVIAVDCELHILGDK